MAGSAAGIRAGKAFVEIGAKDKLSRALARIAARLKAFGDGVASLGLKITGVGLGVMGAIGGMVKSFVTAGSALNDMSGRTGVSVEALSELAFGAEMTGAAMEDLEAGIRKMQRTIAEAAQGSKSANEALETLNLTVADLKDLSPEEQFRLIARRMAQISNPTLRAAAAMEVFGKSGTKLLPMIAELEANSQLFKSWGLVIPTESAARADELGDTLDLLWKVAKNVAHWVGDALAPALTRMTEQATVVVARVRDWIRENPALVSGIAQMGVGILAAGAALVGTGIALKVAGVGLGAFAFALGSVVQVLKLAALALAAMTTPLGLLAVLGTAVGVALVASSREGGAALDWLGERFRSLIGVARNTMGGIVDALAAGDLALAAKVAWAGVKVVWQGALFELATLWTEFSSGFMAMWVNLGAAIQRIWTEVWSGVQSVMESVTNWVAKRWIDLMGLIDEDLDTVAAKGILDQNSADAQAAIEARRKNRLDQISRDQGDALADIGDSARVKESREALEAAKKELAEARKRAAEAKEEAQRDGRGIFGIRMPDFDFDGIAEAIAQKTSSIGTFSAGAAFGLGAGSGGIAERTAKATEETAKNTKRIIDAVQNSGPAFGI